MSELIGFISWPSYHSCIAASLPLSRLRYRPTVQCLTTLYVQSVTYLSRDPPTGAKARTLISMWIRSPRQGSFSSCQHSPAHRFQFLKWSIILFHLFAASLPAATVECDPVVVFCLWPQCNLHSVLKISLFGLINLFIAGVLSLCVSVIPGSIWWL